MLVEGHRPRLDFEAEPKLFSVFLAQLPDLWSSLESCWDRAVKPRDVLQLLKIGSENAQTGLEQVQQAGYI